MTIHNNMADYQHPPIMQDAPHLKKRESVDITRLKRRLGKLYCSFQTSVFSLVVWVSWLGVQISLFGTIHSRDGNLRSVTIFSVPDKVTNKVSVATILSQTADLSGRISQHHSIPKIAVLDAKSHKILTTNHIFGVYVSKRTHCLNYDGVIITN